MDITIDRLEQILLLAKEHRKHDKSLSTTLTFNLDTYSPNHLGGDTVSVRLKSSYADAMGRHLITITPSETKPTPTLFNQAS